MIRAGDGRRVSGPSGSSDGTLWWSRIVRISKTRCRWLWARGDASDRRGQGSRASAEIVRGSVSDAVFICGLDATGIQGECADSEPQSLRRALDRVQRPMLGE